MHHFFPEHSIPAPALPVPPPSSSDGGVAAAPGFSNAQCRIAVIVRRAVQCRVWRSCSAARCAAASAAAEHGRGPDGRGRRI
eukprot:355912-Chlamydomonas_euryale.AAC.1